MTLHLLIITKKLVVFAIDKIIKSLSFKNNVSGHEHHYAAETWKEAG